MFFRLFSKWVNFAAMIMKTILNRFPTFGLRNKFNWNSFFWLFEKIWFFPFVTQHLFSKKWKFSKMGKNGFWWYIRTCHSQFSGFWPFICQNWLKIVVFKTFSFDFNYNYSNKNSTTKIPEKLICSQKLQVGFS